MFKKGDRVVTTDRREGVCEDDPIIVSDGRERILVHFDDDPTWRAWGGYVTHIDTDKLRHNQQPELF
jgi:hypothetical protein